MDEVTQQNAALVEEASAAAHALAEQANSLRDAVAVFTLRGDSSRSGSDDVSTGPGPHRPGAARKAMSPVQRREPELA